MKLDKMKGLILATVMCLAVARLTTAQVQTQSSTTSGTPTREVTIENGEVVAVEGDDLFVKMADGSLRDFPNIPPSARVTVDGQQVGLQDLKPGMKLTHTTVRTTTPQVVTTVETVTGRVFHVTPPRSVILRLENGENQAFQIPRGQRFMVDGRETDAFGLRKGMNVTATRITETPVNVVAHETHVAGTMPAIPANEPVLIAKAEPTPAPAPAAEPATAAAAPTAAAPATEAQQLPKTASNFPLIGLLGLLSIAAAFGLKFVRNRLD